MNLKDFGALCDPNDAPPECVLSEPLEPHLPNVGDFSSAVQALWFDSGPPDNPDARVYVFYFFKGEIDTQRRPDDILSFKVKFDNPFEVLTVSKYLGGMAFGAVNAPALAHRGMWHPGLMSKEAKQQLMAELRPKKSKSGCFVATAVYGTYDAPEVRLLREFRDTVLIERGYGRWFVRAYYDWSPVFADAVRRNDRLRRFLRLALVQPLVRIIQWRLKGR